MPSRQKDTPDFKNIISDIYSGIDASVIQNNAYVTKVQQNCIDQANPFACYFTLLLGDDPTISWRHNTGRHFGIMDLQYEDVFSLVHPAWLFAYVNYAKATYWLAHKFAGQLDYEGAAIGSMVPLKHRSGKYYWYQQVSVQLATDGGRLAAHLNYYQQGTIYDGSLPMMPQILTSRELNKELMNELKKEALLFLPDFLAQFLPGTQVAFMLKYRVVLHVQKEDKIAQSDLLDLINEVSTIENLNKIKQRVKRNTLKFFKHSSLDSALSLGVWLNRYFPLD